MLLRASCSCLQILGNADELRHRLPIPWMRAALARKTPAARAQEYTCAMAMVVIPITGIPTARRRLEGGIRRRRGEIGGVATARQCGSYSPICKRGSRSKSLLVSLLAEQEHASKVNFPLDSFNSRSALTRAPF